MTARDLNFAENTEKTAVGSRTRESATKFAEEHGFPMLMEATKN